MVLRIDYLVLNAIDRMTTRGKSSHSLVGGYTAAQERARAGAESDLQAYSSVLMGGYFVMALLAMALTLVTDSLPGLLAPIVATALAVGAGGLFTLALCHVAMRLERDVVTGDIDIRYGYGPFVNTACFLVITLGFVIAAVG